MQTASFTNIITQIAPGIIILYLIGLFIKKLFFPSKKIKNNEQTIHIKNNEEYLNNNKINYKKCNNCNTNVLIEDKFCLKCGNSNFN
jgi:hypothetical protein